MISLESQFANRWLPPRLQRMLAHPAGANLEIRVEERRADFVTDGVDMAVRYGAGGWPDVECVHLVSESL
ncbi:LysR substrate-binding domain-containing protein, partial [Klebsiella pneumoniae]|uniref:LysR substrate-binding domain-containing protein n=1 Tax=Klebsiella pneumoniae TaxID=573 RepID=UPI0039C48BF7